MQGRRTEGALAPPSPGPALLSASAPGLGLLREGLRVRRPARTGALEAGGPEACSASPASAPADNVLFSFPSQTTSQSEDSGTVFMNI